MWGIISTVFLALYGLMSYYVGRRGWTTLGKNASPGFQKMFWLLLGLMVFTFPISEVAGELLPTAGGMWLMLLGGYSMIALAYLFLSLLFLDSVRILDKGIGFVPVKIKDSSKTPRILGASVLILVIGTLIYGTWNARHPIISNYEVNVAKRAGSLQQLKIAMVSDIHYGAIIDTQRLAPMVEEINQLKPDLIVFAGDFFDGATNLSEVQQMTNIFSQLQAKYGKLAVPGNHDRVLRNEAQVLAAFQAAGVTVLRDKYVKLGDSFYVVGRDDPGHGNSHRAELSELIAGIDPAYPVFLLDHQPVGLAEAQASKVDLQLSGHTHHGQIFPSQLITGRIYELDWGLLEKGAYHLIVSSGYGTWGPPLRIGNHPEVVSVEVKFQ